MTYVTIIKHRATSSKSAYMLKMTQSHTDDNGNEWPTGTKFRPVKNGYDSSRELYYQIVEIDGNQIKFYENRKNENVRSKHEEQN